MRERKNPRLKGFDYSAAGYYFVTFCTKERRQILSRITPVGPDALIGPLLELTDCGRLVEDAVQSAVCAYSNVDIPNYVIMPNHVHLVVRMTGVGPMGASGPTLGMVVRGIKTKVTRAMGRSIWQEKFYDHIIRNEQDYLRIWNYIDTNPARWAEDEYYTNQPSGQ